MHNLPNASAKIDRHSVRSRGLIIVLAIAFSIMLAMPGSALSAEVPGVRTSHIAQAIQPPELTAPTASQSVSAVSLFTKNCAGCHANGGNVVRRSKTLKQKALRRYGYDDVTRISQIITNGKGAMSGYSDRLTPEEIGAIAQYVKAQSETNWN